MAGISAFDQAALLAQRQIADAARAAETSVRRLSSGSRVPEARLDVSSFGIGSRVGVEAATLGQATRNIGQGSSLLQVADGALARVQDLLTRGKVLSVRAGSGNLGDFERSLLDVEYQGLIAEIERIVQDTRFNGVRLLDRENAISNEAAGPFDDPSLINLTVRNYDSRALADGGDGASFFDFSYQGQNNLVQPFTFFIDIFTEGTGFVRLSASLPAELIENPDSSATARLATGVTIASEIETVAANVAEFTAENVEFLVSIDSGFDIRGDQLFGSFDVAVDDGPTRDFNIRAGSGILPSEDDVDFSIRGATVEDLGLTGNDLTTVDRADATLSALTLALDYVSGIRADIAGGLSRFRETSRVLATAIENTEAARSRLLDLDIAREVTALVQKQIRLSLGIGAQRDANTLQLGAVRLLASI